MVRTWDVDAFGLVQGLFHLEDVLVKMKLQLLITVVDAQLLERVHLQQKQKSE